MRVLPTLLTLLLSVPLSLQANNDAQQEFEQQAAVAIKEFASSLKNALMEAMKDGGPIESIAVCNLVAPTIAAEMSKKYGMEIGRTSLRVRNPANEADVWETSVLQQFQNRLNGGEAIQKLTFSEKVETELGSNRRMMKAIPTDKLCLSCHGSKIAEPVQAMIDQYYPEDMATGFKLGDIRGAFTVSREVEDQ
ncbi:DUF3365 domain-containing protein [uncultured Methylophaga sp.]|uniref:Tll0287-like domain-containing protein n=1 Tax=uncultured Methylophaga sp. TaxID=285271 RepID=UPI00261A5290|nr:DUF3365 domain-containing protein [uncultured Methylophaga sp.]